MIDIAQLDPQQLEELGVDQLRELTRSLLVSRGRDAHEIAGMDSFEAAPVNYSRDVVVVKGQR